MAKLDDLIQQKQQRDEDWKAKKTAEREELSQLSDDAVMRVTSEPNAYLRYLDTQAINPQYSAANVMLAMAQNPDITYINSLENWGRLGRSVNREETGLKIRVSDPYVKNGRQYVHKPQDAPNYALPDLPYEFKSLDDYEFINMEESEHEETEKEDDAEN